MHKAVALVSLAPSVEVPAVASFERTSSRWISPFALGSLIAVAAAAAVAFVFLHRTPASGPTVSGDAIAAVPAPVVEAPAATPAIASSLDRADRPSSMLATQTTLRWNSNDLTAPRVQDVRFNWIESLELTAIPQVPSDSFRFEPKMLQKETQPTFGPGASQSPIESNALQFQR